MIESLPRIEYAVIEMVESLLQPKLVIKQILALTALRGGLIFIHGLKVGGPPPPPPPPPRPPPRPTLLS